MTATAPPASAFDPRARCARASRSSRAGSTASRLVYLDNAATTQKPDAGAGRARSATTRTPTPTSTAASTRSPRRRRRRTRRAAGASPASSTPPTERGVVILRNTTEAINLVARSWGATPRRPATRCCSPRWSTTPTWCRGSCSRASAASCCGTSRSPTTASWTWRRSPGCCRAARKIVALTAMSNVLGTINPVAEIAAAAHRVGAVVRRRRRAVGAPHAGGLPGSRRRLPRLLGPQGVRPDGRRLPGRASRSCSSGWSRCYGGGEMIREVRLDSATWNDVPHRFEAGTPNIADAAAFPAALDLLEELGMDAVRAHEAELVGYALERLALARLARAPRAARPVQTRRPGLVRRPRDPPPRPGPGPRHAAASRCAPATTALSR